MRLKSFSVERFRNVIKSDDVPTDPLITCLVGKNESGKTNLLHALATLNPAGESREFRRLDYPTWLEKQHQRSGEFAAARPITTAFELDDADTQAVRERFGDNVLTDTTFTVSKDYDNHYSCTVSVDEAIAVRAVCDRFGIETEAATVSAVRDQLKQQAGETRKDEAGEQVATDAAVAAKEPLAWVTSVYPKADVADAAEAMLLDRLPRFFYFDEYAELQGRTRIEPLVEALRTGDTSGLNRRQLTALCLLQLGYANEELLAADYETRAGEMVSVAADLTQRIRAYWRQNEYLRLRIDIEPVETQRPDGTHIIERYLQLRVVDERHFHENSLDARSSGFRWFVSFLASFAQFEADSNVVVLLDEPALALHARAQDDFLDFIEEQLAPRHQVLYTTHSPFMVEADHLDRVRVVEDTGPELGAVVRTQLMSRDPDTLSPLQGALGYDIAQNIFVGPDNLVVEGLSDFTYLTVISEALREAGRTHLDQRWRVLMAGGAGTMPAAIALLGRELDVTVVVDGGSRPPQKLNQLVGEGMLDGTRIIMLAEFTDLPKADIEDLFDPEDYLRLYNGAMGSTLAMKDLQGGQDRVVSRIERAAGSFNHNDPANWLLAHRGDVVPTLSSTTLDRFEGVVQRINSTLAAR